MANWLEGEVIKNIHWTDKLHSLTIKLPEFPSFTAGQFTRLGLKLNGGIIARPYSLVNSPGDEYLEFYSIVVKEGELSPPLHDLQAGDKIYVSDLVTGFLVLNEIPQEHKKLWLMATGTGIGPFLSILGTKEIWQRFSEVYLVHGVRLEKELTYQELIQKHSQEHANFHYVPFVSRESSDSAMPGRIPAALADGSLEKKMNTKLDPADTHLMLCGNPAMLKDTQEALKDRGFKRNRRRDPGHITTENYW